MNDKKKQLLENGMKLFADKGFHSTTIQEIAKKSGVSKGAFYLHFHSKEDLILSIYKYYYLTHMDRMKQIRQEESEPRESLIKQIKVSMDSILENKEFIIMQMRYTISFGKEVDQFMHFIKQSNFEWNSDNLLAIYGERLKPFIVDATSLLEGLISGYVKWLILDNLTIDTERLARFIVRRTDDCMQGILQEDEGPQLSIQEISDHFPKQDHMETNSIMLTLQSMKAQIDQLATTEKHQHDLHVAIDLLMEEAEKEKPQPVIFKGMLTHFNELPEMQEDFKALQKQIDGDLLAT